MQLRKVLVLIISTFALSQSLSIKNNLKEDSEVIEYRLPDDTIPIHYNIKVIPHIVEDNFTFEGETTIYFKVVKPTKNIALHTRNLTLDTSATTLTKIGESDRVPKDYSHNNETDILVIQYDDVLEPGNYTLSMKYVGILSDDLSGFYRTSYLDNGTKVWMAATQFEAISARRAFPCWDEPALKATFNVSIKHYTNYTALSNMPVSGQSEIDESDGKIWTHFETTPRMSSYLVAFVVADYVNVSNDNNTVNIWCRKELIPYTNFSHGFAQKAMYEMEKYMEGSVKVPKMDHVAIPKKESVAMENWGIITYREIYLTSNEESTITERMRAASIIVHELAHQWFGNIVTPSWWSHLWLSEGFASYFEYYFLDKLAPDWRVKDYFVVNVIQRCFLKDIHSHIYPVDLNVTTSNDIDAVFSSNVYRKAPSILFMMSNIITPNVFRNGLIKYLKTYEYDSVDPDKLWTMMENALDESDVPHNDFNVKEVMDTWIKQKGYPLITVSRNYSTGETKVTQEDFELVRNYANNTKYEEGDEPKYNTWWVPINYATQNNPNFTDTTVTHWLNPQENLTIDGIDVDDWIIINKQQTGYYRVNYDEINWQRIANYLRSENFTKIHVLSRAQIINDAFSMMQLKRLNLRIFLDIVGYLSQETDYVPWYQAFTFLYSMNDIFKLPESTPLKQWVLSLMENIIEEEDFEDSSSDCPLTTMKKTSVMNTVCNFGHPECENIAVAKLLEFIRNDTKISSHKRPKSFCPGLRRANETVWNLVFDWYTKTRSYYSLCCLSNSHNPIIIRKLLKMSLNDTLFSLDEQLSIYNCAVIEGATTDIILDFAIENWEKLLSKLKHPLTMISAIKKNVNTKKQIEKLKTLYEISGTEKEQYTKKLEERLKKIEKDNNNLQTVLEIIMK